MNFTFVRAERSQEENQERAFIAAARRQDRTFKQRLVSLRKASELHFARTGRRFDVTQAQVEHTGPLIELDERVKRREARRFAPYTMDRPHEQWKNGRDGSDFNENASSMQHCSLPMIQTRPIELEREMHNLSQNEEWYQETLEHLGTRNTDAQHDSHYVTATELKDELEGRDVVAEDAVNIQLEDLPSSFSNMDDWQDYHELDNQEMQKLLELHFPR
jgi:hypothetical protein